MLHEGIGELARSRLRGSSYLALRGLGCAYDQGVLTLWGCLPSHDLKQVARTMVGAVAGVAILINAIAVVPPGRRQSVVHDRELQA
jgi:osmotically-inducible protein OsmY